MTEDNFERRILEIPLARDGRSVAWSPDGSQLLIGQADGSVRVVTAEGRQLRSRRPHSSIVSSVLWSSDGRLAATTSWDDTLRVWSAPLEGEAFVIEAEGDFNDACFSPNGRYLAAVSSDTSIRIVDTTTGNVEKRYPGSEPAVLYSVAWSPHGDVVAVGTFNGDVHLLDALVGREIRGFHGHHRPVMAVSWSPDGRLLASLDKGGHLIAWEAQSGRECWRQRVDSSRSSFDYSVSWSPDGGVVASVCNGPASLWDSRNGESLGSESEGAKVGAFSPEGSRFAVVGGSLEIFDVSDLTQTAAPSVAGDASDWVVRQAETVGRRPTMISTPQGATLSRRGGSDGPVVRVIDDQRKVALDLHPTQRKLAIGHENGVVRVVDLEAEVEERSYGGVHRALVTSVKWSADGRFLLTGSYDNTVAILDAGTGGVLASSEFDSEVWAVAWSPDDTMIAAGNTLGEVRVQRSADTEHVWRNDSGPMIVLDLDWSRDGRRLAVADTRGLLRCLDATTGAELSRYTARADWMRSARWASDHRRVAWAADANGLGVWDSATEGPPEAHNVEDWVYAVAWSPCDRFLAFVEQKGAIRVVRVGAENSAEVIVGENESSGRLHAWGPGDLVWSRDGRYLCATQPNRVVVCDMAEYGATAPLRRTSITVPGRLTPELAPLPGTLAALTRLRIAAPLSLVRDLRTLLAGGKVESDVSSLTTLPGMRRLVSLRWRGGALAGLVALLLRDARHDEWSPPVEVDSQDLRRRLSDALRGDAIDPVEPDVSLTPIQQAAEAVGERLMTLLIALGQEAVAADPGVVLRLLRHVPHLPKLAEPQRRLLSLRVAPLEPGPAQGSGIGVDRTGIAPSGPLTALLPSQLAYPRDLFVWRYRNRELLYRARTGREPPRLRPTVLVLDVSPASFGPVEAMTRPAAFVLASTLRRSGLPTVLIAAGGRERVHLLEQPADLVRLFTLRSQERADPKRVMSVAQSMRGSLQDAAVEPVVVLLTQPWWGEDCPSSQAPHVRGLFVQYPGRPVRPVWADHCERWESIDSRDHDLLPRALGRLIA